MEDRQIIDGQIGWHHRFNGHELGQIPGDGEEQGGLAYCSPKSLPSLATEQQQMDGQMGGCLDGWIHRYIGREAPFYSIMPTNNWGRNDRINKITIL